MKQQGKPALNFALIGILLAIFFGIFLARPSWPRNFLPPEEYHISFDVFFDANGTGRHDKLYNAVKNAKIIISFLDKYHGYYLGATDEFGVVAFDLPRPGPVVVSVCGVRQNREVKEDSISPGRIAPVQFPVPIEMQAKCENP